MKKTRILGLFLVFVMLISMCAPIISVFALSEANKETEKETIKYVSLGDSMTNGIGLDGYDSTKHNGYLEVAPESMPAQFAAWLAGFNGEIEAGSGANVLFSGDKDVYLTQLATSAARAEDMLYMLLYNPDTLDQANPNLSMMNFGTENQGKADYWITNEMLNRNHRWGAPDIAWGVPNEYHAEANEAVAETFQTAVKEADVISYAGGDANFGVFFVGRVLNIVGLGSERDLAKERQVYSYMTFENAISLLEEESKLDEKYTQGLVDYVTNIYEEALVYMEENQLPKDMMVEIANYLTYITASYLVTYNKTMDYIASVNPDAEVIVVPLINNATTFEFDFTYNGSTQRINLGELMDVIYSAVNAHMAIYPTLKQELGEFSEMEFYYAELPTNEYDETIYVETFVEVFDELYVTVPEGVTEATYPVNRLFCHNRFIPDIRGFIFPVLVGSEGLYFDEYDVRAYEIAKSNGPAAFIAYCSANAAKVEWITQYLGIIDAVMSALHGTPDLDIDELGMEDMSEVNVLTMVAPFLADLPDNIVGTAMWKMLEEEDENGKTVYEKFREDLIESTMESSFDAYYRDTVFSMVTSQLAPYFADANYGPMLIGHFELDANASDLEKTLRLIELDLAGDTRFEATAELGLAPGVLAGYHNQIVEGVTQAIIDGVDNELQNNSSLQALMVAWCTPEAMDEEMNCIGILSTLLSVYGRLKLANGLSCHPSANGHDTLTQSMIECYENNYTVKDETIKLVVNFVEEHYDEINELIYQYKDIDLSMEECNLLIAYVHYIIMEVEDNLFVEESDKFVNLCYEIVEILDQIRHKNEDHSFTNYIYNNDATCTENGTETAVCDFCDVTDTREANNTAKGHNFTNYIYNGDGVCTENGTMTAKCSDCDEINTVVAENTATGHSFTKYIYNNDATCTKNGTQTAKCDNCDATDTKEVANTKLEHSFTSYSYNHNATCTENGTMTAKCNNCDATNTMVLNNTATGHSFTKYTYDNNATCTQNATKTAKCDKCDETHTLEVAGTIIEHKYTNYIFNNDATCTANGTETSKCDTCDLTDTREALESATGHSFTQYIYNEDATCVANGTKTSKCDDCDATDTKEVENSMVGHNFINHVYNNDATCTENGTMSSKCDSCDETITIEIEKTAKGHNFKDGRCVNCDEVDPDYTSPANQNFFVRIWTWIVNFFRSLFGFGIKQ